jgi:cytochrome c biogenesis protein CcmG/thiol:disulfide interchange protein DsbE
MRQFDGRQTSLADLRGRTLVLNFWASWCVPCREEMPMLEQLSRSERDNGVTVLGVAIEDDELSLTSFLQAFNVTYPAGLDSDNSVARAFEVKGLPTTIVISPTGQIVRRWQGPIDRQRLDSFIAEARAA